MKTFKAAFASSCAGICFSALIALPAYAQNPPTVVTGSSPRPSSYSNSSSDEPGPISVAPPDTMAVPTTPLVPAQTQPQARSASSGSADDGTTIVGDKEAPIGLMITPWKDGYAEHGLDRPARFVDVDTEPIDPDTFQRRVNYYNVITDYRQAHLASGK